MSLKKCTIAWSLICGSFFLGSVSFGNPAALSNRYDFSEADRMFAGRMLGKDDNEKFKNTTTIRAAYEKALQTQLSQEDKMYAVVQIGRLDIARIGLLPQANKAERKDAVADALKVVDLISSTSSQEYYYFYLSFIGLGGKLADSLFERLKYGTKMKSAQKAALASTKVGDQYVGGFEAGGVLRVMAAIRGNKKADALGLYDPDEGLKFAKAALDTRKNTYRPFTESYSGSEYFENHLYYGQAMMNVGLKKSEKQTVQQASDYLQKWAQYIQANDSKLPAERKQERDYYLKEMIILHDISKACLAKDDEWSDCLSEKLEN